MRLPIGAIVFFGSIAIVLAGVTFLFFDIMTGHHDPVYSGPEGKCDYEHGTVVCRTPEGDKVCTYQLNSDSGHWCGRDT